MDGGDRFSVRIFTCVGGSGCPMNLIGELPNEAGYGCV